MFSALPTLAQDLQYAARSFSRARGFTATAVLTLAIGIAANTAVFSLVNAVLFRPLPFPDSSRIVWFVTRTPDGLYANASDLKFNAWTTLTSTFQDVSAFAFPSVLVRSGDHFEEVIAGRVSERFFALFGGEPERGRLFTEAEQAPHGPRVAIISDSMWRRRFQSGDVVGHTLDLDRQSYVIVGVLKEGFDSQTFTTARYARVDVWLPMSIDPSSMDRVNRFAVAARLRPSVRLSGAQAQVATAGAELRGRFPNFIPQTDHPTVQPMQALLARHDRSPLLILWFAVGLVLLMACANVANLLLARGAERGTEIAVRVALGATRGRVVRQLLVEASVLGLSGTALGLALGWCAIHVVVDWTGPTITRIGLTGDGVVMDGRVVVFTCAAGLIALITAGITPALASSRVDLTGALRRGSQRQSARTGAAGRLLVGAQVAITVVLLIAATLFVRTFAKLGVVEPGFDTRNLLTVQVTMDPDNVTASDAARRIANATELVRTVPGVVDTAATLSVPFDADSDASLRYVVEGRPLDGPYHGIAPWRPVGARYFETLRMSLLRGRTFTDADSFDAPPVAVVNQAMANKWWPNGDAIGHRIILGRGTGWDEPPREIVGIVANIRDESLDEDPVPTNYIPLAQLPNAVVASGANQLTWIIRARSSPELPERQIVSVLQQAYEGMPTISLGELSGIINRSRSKASFRMWLMIAFAITAVVLAAVGVYGVAAYDVRRRNREIGIRLALGANGPGVVRAIVWDSLRYSVVGLFVGMGSAAAAVRVLNSLVFGITAHDPLSFITSCLLLTSVAVAAAWLPARRAARLDPIVTLRSE